MRIAALSDIHGNLPALQAVLAEVTRAGVEVTVNLGDIVSGPLWPAETLDLLMPLNLPTIAGNHERQLLTQAPERMGPSDAHAAARLAPAHRDWLAALPATRWLNAEVFCCHGTPHSDLIYLMETVTDDHQRGGPPGLRMASAAELAQRLAGPTDPAGQRPALLLCGHTHVPRVMHSGGTLIVNPGSVGLQAYVDDHPQAHRVEIGSPLARWALLERNAACAWRAELRATPYDSEAAAVQAERHGRGDWADALRTGFVGRLPHEVPA